MNRHSALAVALAGARAAAILTGLLIVAGCSGGTSGTGDGPNGGGGSAPPTMTSISGAAHKGPFVAGTSVSVRSLRDQNLGNGTVSDALGRYSVDVEGDGPFVVVVTGSYLSEISGMPTSSVLTLRAVTARTAATLTVNVNLLTELITPRVLSLVANGMSVADANVAASEELLGALQPLLGRPTTTPEFNRLVVISGLQEQPDTEGNAYLLALSAVLQQVGQNRRADDPAAAVRTLLDGVAVDLADDGSVDLGGLVADFEAAERQLDSTSVVRNLLDIDGVGRLTLRPTGGPAPPPDTTGSDCTLDRQNLVCRGVAEPVAIDSLIGNLDRFIDTDGDGVVNATDTDDDNDGVVDDQDERPLDTALPTASDRAALVPAENPGALETYLKRGLRQWAGVDASAVVASIEILATASPEPVMDAVAAADRAPAAPFTAFSEINLQIPGVDEADRRRFDGEVLYLGERNRVHLAQAQPDPATSTVLGSIANDNADVPIEGLYVHRGARGDKRLTVLTSSVVRQGFSAARLAPWGWRGGRVRVALHDVTDAASPAALGSVEFDGYLIGSRRLDNHLYLVTEFAPDLPGVVPYAASRAERARNAELIAAAELADLLPQMTDTAGRRGPLLQAQNCFLPALAEDDTFYPTLVSLVRVNLDDPTDVVAVCMAESVSGLHVSRRSAYLTSSAYLLNDATGEFEPRTSVHKFAFTDAGPMFRGSGSVRGGFGGNPAFFMGEFRERLAVVTSTGFDSGHRVTVLAESSAEALLLEQVAQIPNADQPAAIGKEGESIYGVRIIGDRAYVVTFLRTDPVYVIDLDPLRVLGELAIPGVSSYLHPVSDDLVLGIGKDAVVDGDRALFQGLKLTLFDVSDPAAPVVADSLTIGRRGSDSPLLLDAHALAYLADAQIDTDWLAFPATVADGDLPSATPATVFPQAYRGLVVLSLNKGRTPALTLTGAVETTAAGCGSPERAFFQAGALHYVTDGQVISAPVADLSASVATRYDSNPDQCGFYAFPLLPAAVARPAE